LLLLGNTLSSRLSEAKVGRLVVKYKFLLFSEPKP
jgi:hypothetical protein